VGKQKKTIGIHKGGKYKKGERKGTGGKKERGGKGQERGLMNATRKPLISYKQRGRHKKRHSA